MEAKRGPKNASLEACDLGLGAGKVQGVNAVLLRYFADVDRVMDLESRIVHCQITLQGFTMAELTKRPHSLNQSERQTDHEALSPTSLVSRAAPCRTCRRASERA